MSREIFRSGIFCGAIFCSALVTGCASSGGHVDDMGVPDLSSGVADDSLPTGAIAFVSGVSCPAGWSEFTDGLGRAVVPKIGAAGDNPDGGGGSHGVALKSGEDRKHSHTVTSTVTLGDTEFVGVAGCCNNGPAATGTVPLTGTSTSDSSGLPYLQLLICKKTSTLPPVPGTIPSGAMLFFDGDTCPDGWTQAAISQGRHLVGLPDGGIPGVTYGGAPLAAGDDRTHAHGIGGTMTVNAHGIALASGCCADGYGSAGTYGLPASSDEGASGFPYINLLQCQKN